jgi:hypothetical protein
VGGWQGASAPGVDAPEGEQGDEMTYILTADLDAEDQRGAAFARYLAYIASVREQFPPRALKLVTSAWYFDSGDHRAPHDARLKAVTVTEATADARSSGSVNIVVRLAGAYQDGEIEFRYRDVTQYRIELRPAGTDRSRGHRDWRYDEFRLTSAGQVEHEIEWWGSTPTATWLIEAADVGYRWLPRGDAGRTLE